MKKITPRRTLFPKEFLVDLNATRAAKRCGYSQKTARQAGARLLSNVNIQKVIRELMEKRQEKLEITSERWLQEMAIVYFQNLPDYMTIDEGGGQQIKCFEDMPKDASRAIESIEETRTILEQPGKEKTDTILVNSKLKIKLHSKIEAGKIIGEHLGFLKGNRLELPGLEKALYEISEKFFPVVDGKKKRSDEPK